MTEAVKFRKWSDEDEKKLLDGIQNNKSFADIGRDIGRSEGACAIRVKVIAVRLLDKGETFDEVMEKTKLTEKDLKDQREIELRKKDKKKTPEKSQRPKDPRETLNEIKELLLSISEKVETIAVGDG